MSFSDANHWRFGWGDGLYNFDEQDKPLWTSFGPCRRAPEDLASEMAAAVRIIAAKATKPIYIAMSGGIDSELIARVFLQERIPFTPLIAQFHEDNNKEDIAYAFRFCEAHKLTPSIVRLDIRAFMQDAINTPYVLANCAHLLQMQLMRHAAKLGGMTIIGVGEQRYKYKEKTIVVPVPIERIAVTHCMQAEQIEAVSAFYCYTPELMLCLLREAKAVGFHDMQKLAHNVKEKIYRTYWPDLPYRPKYSGFERTRSYRRAAQRALKKKYGAMIAKASIPLDLLEQQLSGGRF